VFAGANVAVPGNAFRIQGYVLFAPKGYQFHLMLDKRKVIIVNEEFDQEKDFGSGSKGERS